MIYTPVATNREANASGGRIYAANKWAQFDRNNWGLLDDCVRELPGFGHRIEIPNHPGWIEWKPVGESIAAIGKAIRRQQTSRHFGPLLNLADAPDDITYKLTASDNAKRLPNGDIELAVVSGLRLGIGFSDIRDIATHDNANSEVRLNLRQRKIDAVKRGQDTINLDPTVELIAGDWIRAGHADATSWADVRGVTDYTNNSGSVFSVQTATLDFPPVVWFVVRIISIWDSGVPTVSSATFNSTLSSGTITDVHVSIMRGANAPLTPVFNLGAEANYSLALAAALSADAIGFLDSSGNIAIPADKWSDPLNLAFLEREDKNNTEPSVGTDNLQVMNKPEGANEPFIEYSLIFARRTAHPRTGNRGARVT